MMLEWYIAFLTSLAANRTDRGTVAPLSPLGWNSIVSALVSVADFNRQIWSGHIDSAEQSDNKLVWIA